MKKILFIFMLLGMVQGIVAQPQARRQQAARQAAANKSNAGNITTRAQISFLLLPLWRRMWCGEETSIVS